MGSLKRKKEALGTEQEKILKQIKNNILEGKEFPDEQIHLKEKLSDVENKLKNFDSEIEKLYTSPSTYGEMIPQQKTVKEVKQLGDILEEVEREELHTPRLLTSLDPHPVEAERLI